jgi:sec-independent protein translocase protein TatC
MANPDDYTRQVMTLGQHILELRKRLVLSLMGLAVTVTFACFYTTRIIAFLERPYTEVMKKAGLNPQLQSLAPAEGFMTYFKIAVCAGLIIGAPWVFYHLWKFVSAGLYPNEKRYVYYAVPASVFLFIAGTCFCQFFIAPLAIDFLVSFNSEMLGITSAFTFQNYLSFILSMILTFGLAFQTPVVIFFLNKFGMLPLSWIKKFRRYVIFFVFVASAIICPSQDLISFLCLAGALYILFEIGVLAIYFAGRERSQGK